MANNKSNIITVLNYQQKLEIDITPAADTPTWARVGEGFSNASQSLNEVIYQASYLSDEGYGSTEVTGGQLTFKMDGDRKIGDPAQDYIFSDEVRTNFGAARKTTFRITGKDGKVIQGNCTIAKADITGGDANKVQNISVEIHINGKPQILPALDPLTVVSVAGTLSGKTAIYVNPTLTVGNIYKYKTGVNVVLPVADEILITGWTTWNGTSEIEAVTGDTIIIAEVDSTSACKKAGMATVISKS